jgi:hypothetical protein
MPKIKVLSISEKTQKLKATKGNRRIPKRGFRPGVPFCEILEGNSNPAKITDGRHL